MKLIYAFLLVAGAASAQTPSQPLTVLPLQPTPFPLSFCGQYPQHEVCRPKKEEIITKCIDGFVYKKGTDSNGRTTWIQLFWPNGQPKECKVCMLPEGCPKKE